MKMEYKYRTNEELWTLEAEFEKRGFVKTADCYWTQIMERGEEKIYLVRDENAGAADLPAEEPAHAPKAGPQEKRPARTLAYWRALRNHLQTLACQVNVHSKEYRNLCSRIKWIYDNRLTWRAEAATQAELPF